MKSIEDIIAKAKENGLKSLNSAELERLDILVKSDLRQADDTNTEITSATREQVVDKYYRGLGLKNKQESES